MRLPAVLLKISFFILGQFAPEEDSNDQQAPTSNSYLEDSNGTIRRRTHFDTATNSRVIGHHRTYNYQPPNILSINCNPKGFWF